MSIAKENKVVHGSDLTTIGNAISTALAAKANTSSLAAVATSGSYNDLTNTPTIPTKTSDLTNDSGFARITISTSEPTFSDGENGDIWIVI